MRIKPADLLRKKEKAVKEIDVVNSSDEQIIKLMIDNPDLVKRPIIEKGDNAILALPAERINELF